MELLIETLKLNCFYFSDNRVKPENLLCNGDTVKIADFGLSKDFSMASVMTTCCGSPSYVAPEVLAGGPAYDTECDVWSIGIIAYVLCACLGNT